jgi:hypothetical protein
VKQAAFNLFSVPQAQTSGMSFNFTTRNTCEILCNNKLISVMQQHSGVIIIIIIIIIIRLFYINMFNYAEKLTDTTTKMLSTAQPKSSSKFAYANNEISRRVWSLHISMMHIGLGRLSHDKNQFLAWSDLQWGSN